VDTLFSLFPLYEYRPRKSLIRHGNNREIPINLIGLLSGIDNESFGRSGIGHHLFHFESTLPYMLEN
jgi:hypothetical protein